MSHHYHEDEPGGTHSNQDAKVEKAVKQYDAKVRNLVARKPHGVQPRHGFVIVTEAKPPMSEKAVCALLNAGLALEGTPLRIVEARPED